jgi:hypothetical protein
MRGNVMKPMNGNKIDEYQYCGGIIGLLHDRVSVAECFS